MSPHDDICAHHVAHACTCVGVCHMVNSNVVINSNILINLSTPIEKI